MAAKDDVKAALGSLNKFQIIGETEEQGANSYAFRVINTVVGREEFLKVFYYSEDAAAELLTEPRALVTAAQAEPTSENVVQLYDGNLIPVGSDQYVLLQMEYVEGPSLLSSLQQGPFGQRDSIRVISAVLRGLSNLHSKRILHRDLKPANIVQKGRTPKIADFGSAVLLSGVQSGVSASKHSSLYVPPEGWRNPSTYSFQSDVYQISMVLYELINGQLSYALQHYITGSLLQELKKSGKTLKDLDDFEQSQIADRGIAQLAASQQLLEHGRPPQPYFSDKLKKVIRNGTHPDLSKRLGSADALLLKLSQIDVPNWRPVAEGIYRARKWRDWDWEVSSTKTQVQVKKSRLSADSFRSVANCKVSSLRQAFEFVEKL